MRELKSVLYGKVIRVNFAVKCNYCRGNTKFQAFITDDVSTINSNEPQCSKCGKHFKLDEVIAAGENKYLKESKGS